MQKRAVEVRIALIVQAVTGLARPHVVMDMDGVCAYILLQCLNSYVYASARYAPPEPTF